MIIIAFYKRTESPIEWKAELWKAELSWKHKNKIIKLYHSYV